MTPGRSSGIEVGSKFDDLYLWMRRSDWRKIWCEA